jgi:hypothetical protein
MNALAIFLLKLPTLMRNQLELPGSMHAEDIKDDVKALCRELCLSGKCLYTASNEQLLADGYRANIAMPELSCPSQSIYIAMPSFKMKLRSDKLVDDFMLRIEERSSDVHHLSFKLFDIIKYYEQHAVWFWPGFKSPIFSGIPLKDWGARHTGFMRQAGHGQVERLSVLKVLEHLYEAAAIIVKSQQSDLELSMIYLEMVQIMSDSGPNRGPLGELADAWRAARPTMTRAKHLKQVWCIISLSGFVSALIVQSSVNCCPRPPLR